MALIDQTTMADSEDEGDIVEVVNAKLQPSGDSNTDEDVIDISDSEEKLVDIDTLAPLPPIEEQRRIINELIEEHDKTIVETTQLFVIYESWWIAFTTESIESVSDFKKIGPIDTTGIVDRNGTFCDYHKTPLKALHPQVFQQLQEWYGLTPESTPVTTFAIYQNDRLVPEYAKPFIQLHHLTVDSQSSNRYGSYYSTSYYNSIPSFTLSALYNFAGLLQACIEKLVETEHISKTSDDFANKKFRIWMIKDENALKLPYNISPSTFIDLQFKGLVKKEHMDLQLKDSRITTAHIVIEEKVYNKSGNTRHSYWPSTYLISHPASPSDGRIGLQNLGNTCYMNSALQCLVHIPELTQYFLFNCHEKELNPDNPLGMSGKVALSFSNLIHDLFDKRTNRGNFCVPRDFKQTIGHFNQMFSGYHQQDSQEFLAFLLDGLHEDLNRILKKPFVEKPELKEEDANNIEAIRELAKKSWDHHKLRNDSVIIDLFVGLYKSTLICPDCNKISITFDTFNDLTLPLPVANVWRGHIKLFLEEGPIKTFEIELPKTSTYNTLKKYVATKLNLNVSHLITVEIWSDQFYRNFENSDSQSGYLPISDLIGDKDLIVMYEVRHEEGDLIVPVLNTVAPESGTPAAFGIPFFITLNETERNSFEAIRQKLDDRYEQLSTFHKFSKIRSKNSGSDTQSASSSADAKNVEEASSPVLLADPPITDEYPFKVKVFDSSKETKSRRRLVIPTHGVGAHSRNAKNDVIWTPNTANNFTKLPDLLDSADSLRKSQQTLAGRLDSETGDSNFLVDDDVIDLTNDLEPLDGFEDITQPLDPHSSSTSSNLYTEPLGGEVPEVEVPIADDGVPEGGIDVPKEPANHETGKPLVQERTALVCEWNPDEFDTFFSGLDDGENGGKNTWSDPEVLVNEEVEKLKEARNSQKSNNLTLDECLKIFSKAEVLGEHDMWYCSNCKEHRQASKQLQIWTTPDILSIHLKRFENQRSFSDKIDAVVDFPIEGLDMGPHLADAVEDKEGYIYDLFAVDNHYGGLGGGHYTSYVKNFVDNKWYYYDDSRVSPTTPEKSISSAAYLLFYRKRSSKFLGGENFVKMLETAREEYEKAEKEELEKLERFYIENKESSSSEGEDEDDDIEEEDIDSEREASSINTNNDFNLSSIPVGSDDENDDSAARRKLRLLSRGKGHADHLRDRSIIQSDIESPIGDDQGSSPSDDDCSTYSASVTVPGSMPPKYSVNSPKII